MSRPTIAKINLHALDDNLTHLSEMANGSKIIAVVKANAYGNGAVPVAKHIEQKVDVLAVAFLAEAIELRKAGITKPILILQGPHSPDELLYNEFVNNKPKASIVKDFIWILHTKWQLDLYSQYCTTEKAMLDSAKIWLKFDTGMHRLGLEIDEFDAIMQQYASFINSDTVIMTHLANADEPEQTHALAQIERFLVAVEASKQPLCISNSATHIRFRHARQDYVRLGIALYGSSPFQADDSPIELAPVMSLESQIIALRTIPVGDCVGYGSTWKAARQTTIATVALGYADGYPRHAPSGTMAWCNGELVPLVGRVSMDMLTFDVSDLSNVKIGDTVQLWGDKMPINDVANAVGTIGYELMTRVSSRVPRSYRD